MLPVCLLVSIKRIRWTYGKCNGSHMGGEVLLDWPSCAELITGCDHPESDGRISRYPPMNLVLCVLQRILVLVIYLRHTPGSRVLRARDKDAPTPKKENNHKQIICGRNFLPNPRQIRANIRHRHEGYLSPEFRIHWIGQKNSFWVGEGLTSLAVFRHRHDPLFVVGYCHVVKSETCIEILY